MEVPHRSSAARKALGLTRVLHLVSLFTGDPELPLWDALRVKGRDPVRRQTIDDIFRGLENAPRPMRNPTLSQAMRIVKDRTPRVSEEQILEERKILYEFLDSEEKSRWFDPRPFLHCHDRYVVNRCIVRSMRKLVDRFGKLSPLARSIAVDRPIEEVRGAMRRARKKDGVEACCIAAFKGNVELLSELVDDGHAVGLETMLTACMGGSLEAVKYLRSKGVRLTNKALGEAVIAGSLEILQYCVPRLVPVREAMNHVYSACRNGFLPIVEFFFRHGIARATKIHMSSAAVSGNVDLMKFLVRNGGRGDDWVTRTAATHGHVDLLRYLRSEEDGPRCPWDFHTFDNALENDQYDVLRFILSGEGGHIHFWRREHDIRKIIRYGPADVFSQCVNGARIGDTLGEDIVMHERYDLLRLIYEGKHRTWHTWNELLGIAVSSSKYGVSRFILHLVGGHDRWPRLREIAKDKGDGKMLKILDEYECP